MEWVTTDNVYEEVWRRLLEFANLDIAVDSIEEIHGPAQTPSLKQNYKKQASQIRAALLQAKEYYDSASHASLLTRPNLLYYGAVSLSTAVMLLRGDGNFSLDRLRNNSSNRNHGLRFGIGATLPKCTEGLNLLRETSVQVEPAGHFVNWYTNLKSEQRAYATTIGLSKGTESRNYVPIGGFQRAQVDELINRKASLLDLVESIPDLTSDLLKHGVVRDHFRGEHTLFIDRDNGTTKHQFVIHSAPNYESLMRVVGVFECQERVNFSINIIPGQVVGAVETPFAETVNFKYPLWRETLDHRRIYFPDDIDVPEVVDLFQVSFALSMLARYYPDIWVAFLESHCRGAKLMERIIRVLRTKMPNLMLNQMVTGEYMISTHRPHWF